MQISGLSETQILEKFTRGLKSKTRIEVELREPKTLDKAYCLADCFDQIVYRIASNTSTEFELSELYLI